jgi:hypothetical protein
MPTCPPGGGRQTRQLPPGARNPRAATARLGLSAAHWPPRNIPEQDANSQVAPRL